MTEKEIVLKWVVISTASFTHQQIAFMECIAAEGIRVGREQASQPQWIAVSERLPQLADNVQIKTLRGEVLNAWLQSDNDWFVIHWGQFVPTAYAEAWRIMPEAPEIAV